MTPLLERALQRVHELPEAVQNSLAEHILLEIDEVRWSVLFNSPESEMWLEKMGAAALLELNVGLAKPLTDDDL